LPMWSFVEMKHYKRIRKLFSIVFCVFKNWQLFNLWSGENPSIVRYNNAGIVKFYDTRVHTQLSVFWKKIISLWNNTLAYTLQCWHCMYVVVNSEVIGLVPKWSHPTTFSLLTFFIDPFSVILIDICIFGYVWEG
jgi:hypothetical protein